MKEKCHYGKDPKEFYTDGKDKGHYYRCSRDAEVDGFCIFHKKDYWKLSEENEERVRNAFTKEIEDAKKGKKLECVGYHLPKIKITGEIKGEVYFGKIELNDINFKNVTFQKLVDFSWTTFNGETIFLDTVFNGEVRFHMITFNKTTYFDRARFQQQVKLGFTNFNKNVYIRDAVFSKDAEFNSVKFFGESDFIRTRFEQKVKFYSCKFEKNANFGEIFSVNTKFMHTEFKQKADFKYSDFGKITEFFKGKFQHETNFSDVVFLGRTKFDEMKFKKSVDFSNAFFGAAALFKETFVIDEKFPQEKETNFINFRRCKFKSPNEIIIDNCNLCYASFIHTNITRVKFRNITWPQSFMLLDDILLEKKKIGSELHKEDPDLTIENVLTVYRMLRENYEYNVDYETAGRFFVGEMETKRRNSDSIADKTVLWLYKLLALYGQSYTRPLFALISLIVIFFLIRVAMNLYFQETVVNNIISDNLWKSIAVSTQFRGNQWIDILQWILSLPLLVLFGLALRRRFERRFRH